MERFGIISNIMVWGGRGLKYHLVPPPMPWHLPLNQVAQIPVQPGPKRKLLQFKTEKGHVLPIGVI